MNRASTVRWFRAIGISVLLALFSCSQLRAQAAFEALSRATKGLPELPSEGPVGDWVADREQAMLALLPGFRGFEQALDKEISLSSVRMTRDMLMRSSIFAEPLNVPGQPAAPFREARKVASLALFCGWLRQAHGEPLTAIRRDLQALRVGMELLRSSTMLIEAMTAVGIERSAWESLGNKLMEGGLDSEQMRRVSLAIQELRMAWDFRAELVKALDRSSETVEWMVRGTVGKVSGGSGKAEEAIRLMHEYDAGVRDCLKQEARLIDGCVRLHVKTFLAAGHEKRNSALATCLANYGDIGARVAETLAMRDLVTAASMLAEFRAVNGRPPRDSNEIKGLTLDPLSRTRTRSIIRPDVQILGMSGNDRDFDDYDPARDLVLAPRALRSKFRALAAYVKPLNYREALVFECHDDSSRSTVSRPCDLARLELDNGLSQLRSRHGLQPACDIRSVQSFLVANGFMQTRVECKDGGVLSWQNETVRCSCTAPPAPARPEPPVPATVSAWGTASCTQSQATLGRALDMFNLDHNSGLTDLSESMQAQMIAGGYLQAGCRCPDGGTYALEKRRVRCSKHPE
ncbi:MAG: hypothetical protein HY814_14405 [Candidatus Riflebacteria bacterium]|nr:hypothetical protein [Candidatus Riflebacteria bacterium]